MPRSFLVKEIGKPKSVERFMQKLMWRRWFIEINSSIVTTMTIALSQWDHLALLSRNMFNLWVDCPETVISETTQNSRLFSTLVNLSVANDNHTEEWSPIQSLCTSTLLCASLRLWLSQKYVQLVCCQLSECQWQFNKKTRRTAAYATVLSCFDLFVMVCDA